MYFGDHDKQMRFVDRITPNFEAYFGKWFTPGIGIRLGANGYKIKGVSGWTGHNLAVAPNLNRGNYGGFITDWNPATHTGKVYQHANVGYPLYETEQQYIHAHADVLFNLTQMVCGYNEDRFYSLIPYAGLGFATTLERASTTGRHSNEVTASVGILNRFRINRAWDINLDIRGAYVGDHFDQEDVASTLSGQAVNTAGRWGEGLVTATVGVSYNFPKRGWDRSTVTTIRVNENVLNDLRGRLSDLEGQNSDARKRAEVVYNCLVNEFGVSESQLKKDSHGGVANMYYNDPRCSRSVLSKVAE